MSLDCIYSTVGTGSIAAMKETDGATEKQPLLDPHPTTQTAARVVSAHIQFRIQQHHSRYLINIHV